MARKPSILGRWRNGILAVTLDDYFIDLNWFFYNTDPLIRIKNFVLNRSKGVKKWISIGYSFDLKGLSIAPARRDYDILNPFLAVLLFFNFEDNSYPPSFVTFSVKFVKIKEMLLKLFIFRFS